MSLSGDLLRNLKDTGAISTIRVDKKSDYHGESAIKVVVDLVDGRRVEGLFTTESRSGFGGVQGSKPKDIVGLMSAKVRSVLEGTAE